MSDKPKIGDVELHAFVDDALDAGRRREVEAVINADPALAARVAAYRADKEMLKRLYAPIADRPLPEKWLALARGSKVPGRPAMSWRLVGSIAAAILVVAGTAGYWQMRTTPAGEIVQAALDARDGPAHAEQIVAVNYSGNTKQYDGLLRSAVAMNVKVPDLSKMGYRLAGIHLYQASSSHRAAELLYRDKAGRLFTLYVRRSDGSTRFDQFERSGLRVCVWQDDELSTVMAGDMSTAAMQRLASLAYTGLTL